MTYCGTITQTFETLEEPSPVTSGVPQGTVLVSLLFLLYVNDLPDNLKSSLRLFADDASAIRCHLKWGGRWPTAGWPTTEIKYEAKQMANGISPSKCKTLSISTNKVPPQRKYVFLWNQTGIGWMYFLSECIIERTSEVVQTRYISFRGTLGTVQNTCLHSHSSSEAWICLCRLRPIPPKGHCFAWEDPEKSGTVFLRQLSFHSQRYWNVSR